MGPTPVKPLARAGPGIPNQSEGMVRRVILTGLVAALSSCVAVEAPTTTTLAETTAPTTTTSTTVAPATTPPPPVEGATVQPSEPRLPPIPPCLTPEPPFGTEGEIDNYAPTGSDSALLAAVEWHTWESCQRFVFSMASPEGAPTLVPPSVTLLSLQDQGVLRLQFGLEIETSAVAYQLIEGPLVERYYVVRSHNGGLMVDFHLTRPVAARLLPSSAPATLTIDLRPDGETLSHQPVISPRAVVFLPPEQTSHYPFTVSGYLQPGIEESVATLTGSGDHVAEARFPLTGADDVWSSFAAVFPEGSSGWVTLEVEGARARLLFRQ